ncbi:MAG: hypothetical protein GY749_19345 [Desulfobacteraceae bacterium]|nr:hypothetical protein [Desulfobacteraceae bacterium]
MMKKWTITDRYGNIIYLTEERWHHILESRPELEPYFEEFLDTIRAGRRKQDPLIPNEYRYFKQFDELLPENSHLVAIVIFKTRVDKAGNYIPNNFVVTGWAKYIVPKR